ncbi:M56 family metallopeptidase [Anaerotruncus colihominis]|uniref:M56 family metallopeptidase n=1 Tax=Anaerotruncus colihominis TaxID=169435 RepID=UPI0035140ED5
MSLVQMTLSGGAFILFIVVVRALALHRLPKGAFLALWEMAALRLLLPFTIPLPFSLFAPAKHLPVVGDYLAAGGAAVPGAPAVGIPNGTPAQAGTAPGAVLPMVWLAGAALMAAYFTVSYVRARRRFRASTPDDTPAVRRWLAGQTLRRPLKVRQSALVSSPLTYGVLRPVILLPEDMERGDETALTYILTHEYIHIWRFDSVTKLVFAAVLCVHWFNPLAWVMYVLANRDLELSCDEWVMDTLGGREKASYALTLINMEETRSRCFSPYNHFSKLAIEERIEAIMKYKKASVLALALAVALVVGATTAFAASASPLSKEQQDRQLNSEPIIDEGTLMSYVDPKDGKTYYSFDGGKTFEAMTDEEFERRFPTPNIEWWTYEEYAAWLEQEKVNLQAMLGETGSTGGRGEFVWTQEIIDETIAMYEGILQEIKEGMMYSKSVNGDENLMMSYNPADIESGTGKPVEADAGKVQAAAKVAVSDGYVFTSEKDGVPLDDWDVAQAPQYTPEEWQQIIADIESGKIPPFEIPNDPNVTVRFVNYPGGNDVAKD